MKVKKIMIFVILIFFCTFNINAATYLYNLNGSNNTNNTEINNSVEENITTLAKKEASFQFQSQSQYLVELATNTILYAKNEDEKLLPASVTKVMSLLLIMEEIENGKLLYTDKIRCSQKASSMGGSQIWFKEGEELTVDECLKAICMASANDCVVAMAEHIAGNEENFVALMNKKAKELNMINTNFMNCHGIDEDNHYTTAKDIAIMSRELVIKYPKILEYTSIWMDSLRNGEFGLTNTNKLIRFYEGANGLKTGSTSQALFNLVATATRNNTTFLGVVMRAPTSNVRTQEMTELLNYAFANYETQEIYIKNSTLEEKKVEKCITESMQVGIEEDVKILKNKGEKIEIEENIVYNNLVAPIKKGDVVGRIEVYNKDRKEKLAESNIISLNDINKTGLKGYFTKLTQLVSGR